MSGVGENRESYQALQEAFAAYAKESYGEEYVLQDFVMVGYVVSLGDDNDDDRAEYVLATSSKADHIIQGLANQVNLFQSDDEPDD